VGSDEISFTSITSTFVYIDYIFSTVMLCEQNKINRDLYAAVFLLWQDWKVDISNSNKRRLYLDFYKLVNVEQFFALLYTYCTWGYSFLSFCI